jgi:hypothetical protein
MSSSIVDTLTKPFPEVVHSPSCHFRWNGSHCLGDCLLSACRVVGDACTLGPLSVPKEKNHKVINRVTLGARRKGECSEECPHTQLCEFQTLSHLILG